ncbi:Threonine/homoserine/homoserine lactone efflux protein [Algoriphagus locisalis]|uniref:Threonine/homoserine/homoserine lactone efflux protein n=1 Tax=Algoriphagus locisalis TaxID=305507 RepID=A0A1I6XXN3_9BACT|nr:LysE family transporter [Algoriphagus locisalis]SFT42887.1 Threonine/homoserine/homoserine lactone efflux protein [Algoriphagus locisalis]
MSQALLEGISMGLLLSAMIGPVFFTLIQSSLEKGFRYAAMVALGIQVSDALYVLLTFFGVKFLAKATYFEAVLGYVGGAILIGFGIAYLVKKQTVKAEASVEEVRRAKKRSAFLKGFSINGINPFVLLFWISIASLIHLKTDFDRVDFWSYYLGILLTVFSIDLIKAFIAKQLAQFVTPKVMFWLNKAVGVAMIGFGFRLILFAMA